MNEKLREKELRLIKEEEALLREEREIGREEEDFLKKINSLLELFRWVDQKISDFKKRFPEFSSKVTFPKSDMPSEFSTYLGIESEMEGVLKRREELIQKRKALLKKRRDFVISSRSKLSELKEKILQREKVIEKVISELFFESSDSSKERRRDIRVVIDVPVTIEEGHTLLKGNIGNISKSGIFVKSNLLLPEGKEVLINLKLPDGSRHTVSGVVVWTNDSEKKGKKGMGIAFKNIPRDILKKLEQNLRVSFVG